MIPDSIIRKADSDEMNAMAGSADRIQGPDSRGERSVVIRIRDIKDATMARAPAQSRSSFSLLIS
jgi:hypothetical protein